MPEKIERPIIFTDLDGTLLDHDTYSWEPAAAALAQLQRRGIPVVLNSSKTLAELEQWRRQLGLKDPLVCENGAFIDVPSGYFATDMPVRDPLPDRPMLQAAYLQVRAAGGFRCVAFFELGTDGIAAATGLDREAAERANQRFATEPVLWQDSAAALLQFRAAIEGLGLRCLSGGRFVHVMGNADKATAMQDLMAAYVRMSPTIPRTSIALGDGPNDATMLAAASIAVVVRGRHRHAIALKNHPRVVYTREYGPVGWQNAVSEILGIE